MVVSPSDLAPTPRRSAIHLLADPVSRAVVVALGEAHDHGVDSIVVTEEPIAEATPRLIRSRLRELEAADMVEPAPAAGGQPRQWRLTTAGRDLYRLLALMTRIVLRASQLGAGSPPVLRERMVSSALATFADPVAMRITRVLASAPGPIGPTVLEEGCRPVARRTLYRRLTPLLEFGVVERTSGRTVPRTTFYGLADRWRPAAAVPMLAAWWESRHWDDEPAVDPLDFEAILQAVLPLVRFEGGHHGKRLTWQVTGAGPSVAGGVIVSGERLLLATANDSLTADVRLAGTPRAWGAAVVSDRRDELEIEGDEALGLLAITAVRAVLLAYVR